MIMQTVTVAVVLDARAYNHNPPYYEAAMWRELWNKYILPVVAANQGIGPVSIMGSQSIYKPDPLVNPAHPVGDHYVKRCIISAGVLPVEIEGVRAQQAAQLAADMEDLSKW